MTHNINDYLYLRVKRKGFKPSHVAEIGVWHPDTSNLYQYIQDGLRATLIEPDPDSIKLIKSKFGHMRNVTLHEVAICDFDGMVELYKRGSSTFVSILPSSPAMVNDNFDMQTADKFTAEARLFSAIDDGTIDLLSIDTEGSEWFVVKNMKSRPTIISLETHGGMYVNPYIEHLLNWLKENNYVLWYKDKSDSVYVLQNVISVSVMDRINIVKSELIIIFKSIKKKWSISLKSTIR